MIKHLEQDDGIWTFFNSSVIKLNFPADRDDGGLLSPTERKFAADSVNFRVGPARLFQFREKCQNYTPGWLVRNKTVPEYEFESPLLKPWLGNKNGAAPKGILLFSFCFQ